MWVVPTHQPRQGLSVLVGLPRLLVGYYEEDNIIILITSVPDPVSSQGHVNGKPTTRFMYMWWGW